MVYLMNRIVLALVALVFVLSACGTEGGSQSPTDNSREEPWGTEDSVTVINHQRIELDGVDDVQVYVFELSDGTRCASTGSDAGIDCDWK